MKLEGVILVKKGDVVFITPSVKMPAFEAATISRLINISVLVSICDKTQSVLSLKCQRLVVTPN